MTGDSLLRAVLTGDRRSVRTVALVMATIGAALWLDLSVLGPSLTLPAAPVAAPSPDTDPIVVDVTLPGGAPIPPASVTAADAPPPATPVTAGAPASVATFADDPATPAPLTSAATPVIGSDPVASPTRIPATDAPPTTVATTTTVARPTPTLPPTTRPPAPPPTTTPPATTTTTRPPTTTAPPPPTATYRTVTFDGVGSAVITDHGDGTMDLSSCSPDPGWAYRIEGQTPTYVSIKFRRTSGEGEAKLDIRMRSDGSLSVQRER